jgi:hypothetical protein
MKTGILSLLLFWVYHTSAQEYHVKKVAKGVIRVDGRGASSAWGTANLLTDFVYPWDSAVAPATAFSALWDGEWLYGLFRVKDDSIFTPVMRNDKIDVAASDRAEIFLKKDDLMNPYYCLELDADGRVLDYNAFYYRKVNYPWSWPSGQLVVKAARVADGYVVEFAISIQSLRDLGLLEKCPGSQPDVRCEGRLQAGLFRAECKGMAGGRSDLRWISWIRPRTDHPDFHTPSAFGVLVLE